jgi:xanthine/uracil permease
MFAGLVVTLIGLAVVFARSYEIPRHWTPVIVGIVLFLIGASGRALTGRGESTRP